MDQPDFFEIPSPCIGVCQSNSKGYCKGCLRSREERLYWLQMNDHQKHQVMRLLALRRKKLRQAAWADDELMDDSLQADLDFEA